MGYPEDLLAPQEKLLLHRHQHWKALVGATIWLLVLTGAAVALLVWLAPGATGGAQTALWWGVAVAWVGLVAWLCVAPFVAWATTHFVITDRRILYRTGIITRSGIDIPVARINTVQFRHGLIDRMFRTGTLIIESASDDPLEFDDIPEVEKVHAMLYNELYDELHDDESPR
ncbi:PH domain-containing protein [Demequina activiva]|uniref:Membrane protein n=1 Tax=Demequina activiva TaxID=1582364 RepID=A0A919Q6J0_9MICO|nr:PH domain-containing protein [Demequina activiva]GIG55463.1 membrane protein [Demequina activiva]